jgi:hypothetical protein
MLCDISENIVHINTSVISKNRIICEMCDKFDQCRSQDFNSGGAKQSLVGLNHCFGGAVSTI